jgi:hypothetical protein
MFEPAGFLTSEMGESIDSELPQGVAAKQRFER